MQWNNRIFFCSQERSEQPNVWKIERDGRLQNVLYTFSPREEEEEEQFLFVIVTCGSVSMLFQKLLSLTCRCLYCTCCCCKFVAMRERNMMPVLAHTHFVELHTFWFWCSCVLHLVFFLCFCACAPRSFWYCWLLFPSDSEWILFYNMQCSFGCHENFKIFVCIILFVYDCVFLIFYFQLFSRGFCGRGWLYIYLCLYSNGHSRSEIFAQTTNEKYMAKERARGTEGHGGMRHREIKSANIMIWWFALCWWNGINETQFNI